MILCPEHKTSPNLSKGEEQHTALAFRLPELLLETSEVLSRDIKLIACPDENRDGSYLVWICNAAPLLLLLEKEMEDEVLLSSEQEDEECDATDDHPC